MRHGIGRTDIGKVRAKNQDTIFISNEKIGPLDGLYIVADGMGGHKAGEVASCRAIEFFCEYTRETGPKNDSVEEYLREGVQQANARVFNLASENADFHGMGTTFSLCAFKDRHVYYAHIGDSRIYLATSFELKRISNDHSFVAEMVRLGRLSEEDAWTHPNKNVLTRAMGTDLNVEVDTGNLELSLGSRLLICSDGLSNMVSDNEIFEIMKRGENDDAKADALLELALQNGGRDNISLIIVAGE